MAKPKIITKEKFTFFSFIIWCVVCVLRTLYIMIASIFGLIPFVNQILWKYFILDEDGYEIIQDNIWKISKMKKEYKVIKRVKVIEETLEEV